MEETDSLEKVAAVEPPEAVDIPADRVIPVQYYLREGEYSPTGRFEFPHHDFIYAILEVMPVSEQKKYKLYFFKNVLIITNYSESALRFLQDGAKKAGFGIEFVKKKV